MAFLDEIRKESIDTIEGSIYFDKIIGNGIIKSVNNKYVKMYKIEDINYRLSDDEGKLSILSNFMNFFNNTDRDMGISIIMTCKQNVDEFYIISSDASGTRTRTDFTFKAKAKDRKSEYVTRGEFDELKEMIASKPIRKTTKETTDE